MSSRFTRPRDRARLAELRAQGAAGTRLDVDLHLVPVLVHRLHVVQRRAAEPHALLAGVAELLVDDVVGVARDLAREEHAGAVGDDDGRALEGQPGPERRKTRLVVVGVDGLDVLDPQRAADRRQVDRLRLDAGQRLDVAGVGLPAGHRRDAVVLDQDGDVGPLMHGVEETGEARVQEGRVADHGDRPLLAAAGAGEALLHRDAATHLDGGVHVADRWQRREVVAADVAVHVEVELLHRRRHAAVWAAGAKDGGPRNDGVILCGLLVAPPRQVEAGGEETPADTHRSELAPLREPLLALADDAGGEDLFLQVRFELLDHEEAVDGGGEGPDRLDRQRVDHAELEEGRLGQRLLGADVRGAGADDADANEGTRAGLRARQLTRRRTRLRIRAQTL